MAELRFRDNLKVHWAGAEVANQFLFLPALGVRYFLYTAFPFVERRVFGKGKSPIIPLKRMRHLKEVQLEREMIQFINSQSLHTIQDSGLFTLMFGSQAGKKDEALMNKWYDNLIEFTLDSTPQSVSCVECDCQKVLGVDKAWEFRERMRNDLKKHRVINVFHREDGQKGLDRLIEFSDYIAISVPELRFCGKKDYVPRLASYIKNKKPAIDIHLLGCTEIEFLKACDFCTSADSTSWVCAKRFGFINKRHVSSINTQMAKSLVSEKDYVFLREQNNETNTNTLLVQIYKLKAEYESAAGNQDYFKEIR